MHANIPQHRIKPAKFPASERFVDTEPTESRLTLLKVIEFFGNLPGALSTNSLVYAVAENGELGIDFTMN